MLYFFRESNPVLIVENIAFKQFNFLRYQDFFFLLVMQPPHSASLFSDSQILTGLLTTQLPHLRGFPGGSAVKNPPYNAGAAVSIPGLGRSPGGGHGNPLQYSCLENPTDRGAWGYSP